MHEVTHLLQHFEHSQIDATLFEIDSRCFANIFDDFCIHVGLCATVSNELECKAARLL